MRGGAVPRPTSDTGAHAAGSSGGKGGLKPSGRRSACPFRRGAGSVSPGAAALEGSDMTRHRSFKRLVRARMEKTGESYTAARRSLLAGRADGGGHREPGAAGTRAPKLPMSDEAVRRRTDRGWKEWFDLLDDSGVADRGHRRIAGWIAEEHGIDGWWAQSVTVAYERARGMRAVGERPDGFAASASKTVAVPVERLFEAFTDPALRKRWLPDAELAQRTATSPRSARFDWGDGSTRVNVTFLDKGTGKSAAQVQHERLRDAGEAGRFKAYWRERLGALKQDLER